MSWIDKFYACFDSSKVKKEEDPDLKKWTEIALKITSDFEGHDGFSNVIGNFDGMGLTAGAIGFNFGMGTMQPLVLKFEKQNVELLHKLMPQWGQDYLRLCHARPREAVAEIGMWSHGSRVKAPIKAELKALWSSGPMVHIQIDAAGGYGQKAAKDSCFWVAAREDQMTPIQPEKYLSKINIQEFCYFFDMRVMNGSSKGLTRDSVALYIEQNGNQMDLILQDVVEWCSSRSTDQAAWKDCKRNGELWKDEVSLLSEDQQYLMIFGWLRALKSNFRWQPATMNRRGIFAAGLGWTEGEMKNIRQSINMKVGGKQDV